MARTRLSTRLQRRVGRDQHGISALVEMINKFFTLPEILLNTFSYLPQQDLLIIQRVCRTWKGIIASSIALQENLFFRPRRDLAIEGEFNPILVDKFPSFFDSPSFDAAKFWMDSDWHRRRKSSYKRPEASWRRMIPCNPAPIELQLIHNNTGRSGTWNWKIKILETQYNGQFFTFGMLHDIAERAWFGEDIFPAAQRIKVCFGPLTLQQDLLRHSDEHGRRLTRYIHTSYVDQRRRAFPNVRFDELGQVLVHMQWPSGCGASDIPRRSYLHRSDEFRNDSFVIPDFDSVVISSQGQPFR